MKKDARKTCACDCGSRANPPTPDICFADFIRLFLTPCGAILRSFAFAVVVLPHEKKYGEGGSDTRVFPASPRFVGKRQNALRSLSRLPHNCPCGAVIGSFLSACRYALNPENPVFPAFFKREGLYHSFWNELYLADKVFFDFGANSFRWGAVLKCLTIRV